MQLQKKLLQNDFAVVITGRNISNPECVARELGKNVFPMVWNAMEFDKAEEKINKSANILDGFDIGGLSRYRKYKEGFEENASELSIEKLLFCHEMDNSGAYDCKLHGIHQRPVVADEYHSALHAQVLLMSADLRSHEQPERYFQQADKNDVQH